MGELPFPDPQLEADSVRLRAWSQADVPAIVAACQDPSIARWSPVIPFPYGAGDAAAWLAGQEPARLAGEALDLAVVAAETGSVLGSVGINGASPMLRNAAIGYWLAPDARGHGYMTTAVRLLTAWAFERLGLARLELTTDPENGPSQRVAERGGFRREGYMRSHMRILHSGERRDSLLYGLLPEDLG
jgi:RimJ/RimL family protein N-acetyltransferase